MNGDASWQLKFAREFKFINWHPPLMSVIWRPLDKLLPGAGSLFLLQIGLYWLSIAIFAREYFRANKWKQIIAVLIAGFSPALFIGMTLILKDALSVGLLMLGASLIKLQERKKSHLLKVLAFIILFDAVRSFQTVERP